MADTRDGTDNIQDDPGASCSARDHLVVHLAALKKMK